MPCEPESTHRKVKECFSGTAALESNRLGIGPLQKKLSGASSHFFEFCGGDFGNLIFQGIPRILGKSICTKPQVKPPTSGPSTNRRRSRHYMDHSSATEPTNAVRRHVVAVDGGSGKTGFPRISLEFQGFPRKIEFCKISDLAKNIIFPECLSGTAYGQRISSPNSQNFYPKIWTLFFGNSKLFQP